MTEHLGLECRWLYQGMYGGASGIIGMMEAARAISRERRRCGRDRDRRRVRRLLAHDDDAGIPVRATTWAPGATALPNGMFALHTRLYMERNGATREDFGRLYIAQRENALLNPNALFDEPLTIEDYLGARPDRRADPPLRLRPSLLRRRCGGSGERGRSPTRLDVPMVRLLAGGAIHNYPAHDIYALSAGWETFRDRMYEQAELAA